MNISNVAVGNTIYNEYIKCSCWSYNLQWIFQMQLLVIQFTMNISNAAVGNTIYNEYFKCSCW